MFEQLEKLEKRYQELEHILASNEAISNKILYNKYAKEFSDLKVPVLLFREYKKISCEYARKSYSSKKIPGLNGIAFCDLYLGS